MSLPVPTNAASFVSRARVCAAGGHISGANFNPAVSLALLIRGALSLTDFAAYVGAQMVGSFAGGLLGSAISPIGGPTYTASLQSVLVAEIVLTFALCHTVIHTATVAPAKDGMYYGLAIGFTVLSGAISVGGISGGAFNPAVGVGLTILTYGASSTPLMVYTVGPCVGAALAGFLFKLTHPTEASGTIGSPGYQPYVMEFIGTFLLCFTVATAADSSNDGSLAALSIGSILMTQVYAGAATSGANYNPAVTLALFLDGKLKGTSAMVLTKAVGYVGAQLAGGAAAFFVGGLVGCSGAPAASETVAAATVAGFIPTAVVVEAIGTFFLVFVVLQVAVSSNGGKDFFGLAIGFTVTSMAITLGGLSGGAFNPAVGMLSFLGSGATLPQLCNYVIGPSLGAVVAVLSFRFTNSDDYGSRGYLEMS